MTKSTKKAATVKKSTKAAKKAAPKKAVKKTTAKKPTKKAAPKKTDAKPTNGLTVNQIKILKALKNTKPLTGKSRGQLIKTTGINGGWSKNLGAVTRDDLGVQGGGLAGMGLIKIVKLEDSRVLTQYITKKGLATLAKATK